VVVMPLPLAAGEVAELRPTRRRSPDFLALLAAAIVAAGAALAFIGAAHGS
jgi:hypothetical protein